MTGKIRMEDMDPSTIKAFRKMIREEVRVEFRIQLKPVKQSIDTLTGEVIELQTQTKALWDKVALGDERNKREIDEIKNHLGLKPLDPL